MRVSDAERRSSLTFERVSVKSVFSHYMETASQGRFFCVRGKLLFGAYRGII